MFRRVHATGFTARYHEGTACERHFTRAAMLSCSQVEELLQLDASNEEYQELAKSLEEVIELTEDLLREAAGGAAAAPSQPGAPDVM